MLVRSQSRQTLPSRRPLGQGYLILRIFDFWPGTQTKIDQKGKKASRVFTSRSKVF
ncbi:hypothetical protein GHT06_018704 [Daphnia sinensis]|uniref:Uncharacterized protein n=1 Tax=Daphnia sinensis TaxID=1820382 RepID=A0AAD5L6C3_9CRUS|nr:hypothetical protein GHT06_018704 [Daphnia sinensis]